MAVQMPQINLFLYNAAIQAKNIFQLITPYRLSPAVNEPQLIVEEANEKQIERLLYFTSRELPIEFVLPAFPAKSPNLNKTSGILPDFGEVLALERLNTLCKEIQKQYAPGAKVIICSDGRVFSDVVKVSDSRVNAYSHVIQRIIKEENLLHLDTFNLENYFTDLNYQEMREALENNFAPSLLELKTQVLQKREMNALFNGIHRFLFEDSLFLHPDKSRNQVRNESKVEAYTLIQRSQAWSHLLNEKFPFAFRLSIHPHPWSSEKFGIRLVDSPSPWATPWHSVVLKTNGEYHLVKRQELNGAVEMLYQNKYIFYTTGDNKRDEV